MKKSKENNDKLVAWLKGDLSDDQVKADLSEEELTKYKQILDEVDSWVPESNTILPAYDEIIATEKETPVIKIISQKAYLIAASVSILMIASLFIYFNIDKQTTIISGINEIIKVDLPDNSVVYLSANSEIKWNDESWSNERTVLLSGKAYFEVNKGVIFSVVTDQGSVQVLGTRFEVDDFKGGLAVTCFEGKVRASSMELNIDVEATEAYTFYEDKWNVKPINNDSQPLWIQNKQSFKNAPLLQVFRALEATYGLTIHSGKINIDRNFSGTFPSDDLELTLKIIFEPLEINYKIESKDLYLGS